MNSSYQQQIGGAEDIYNIMQRILMRESRINRDREHFWTVSLDSANKILNIELVSKGSVSRTLAEPMEVFSIPLQKRAVKVVLVHNHPSGTLTPSDADKDVTDHLIQVGRIMQVPVLDHLIITEKSYYSFSDSGILKILSESDKYVPAYELKKRYEKAAIEVGERNSLQQVAKAMKKKGFSLSEIAEITNLPEEVIKKLKK